MNKYFVISILGLLFLSCAAGNSMENLKEINTSLSDSTTVSVPDSIERMLNNAVYFRKEFDSCGIKYLIQEYYPVQEPGIKSMDVVKITTIEYSDTSIAYTYGLYDNTDGNCTIYTPKFTLSTIDSFYYVTMSLSYPDYLKLTEKAPKSIADLINRAKRQFYKVKIDSSGIAAEMRHRDWILRFKKEYLPEGVLLIPDGNTDFSYLVKYPSNPFTARSTIDSYRLSQILLPPFLFNNRVDYYRLFGPVNRYTDRETTPRFGQFYETP